MTKKQSDWWKWKSKWTLKKIALYWVVSGLGLELIDWFIVWSKPCLGIGFGPGDIINILSGPVLIITHIIPHLTGSFCI